MKYKEILKNYFQIEHFKKALIIASVILVAALLFLGGVFVGAEKARFSYGWGEHYYENFVGKHDLPSPLSNPDHDYINAHGVFGEVIKTEGSNLVIKSLDNTEIDILTDSHTIIRSREQDLKIADIKVDDNIVVIGAPNSQGQIQAKFIRLPSGKFPY